MLGCGSEPNNQITPNDERISPAQSNENAKLLIELERKSTTNLNRYSWQKPGLVLNLLGDIEGKVIADIGAGPSGYFALQIPKRKGRVIAIDIDQRSISNMEKLKNELLSDSEKGSFETRLAKIDDPLLNENEADYVIIINTIFYIENRLEYLKKLKTGIKPGGKILIADFKMKRIPIDVNPEFKNHLSVIEEDLYQAGYSNILTNDCLLDYQYLLVGENLPK
jgi:ubiquinone/menaquinone biosynthesis C-methylase UbiE